ncbi:MAG: hypothetical protein V4449_00825 [Patescibacteria group bacterium]
MEGDTLTKAGPQRKRALAQLDQLMIKGFTSGNMDEALAYMEAIPDFDPGY